MKLYIINPVEVEVDFDNHIIKVEVEDGSLYNFKTDYISLNREDKE